MCVCERERENVYMIEKACLCMRMCVCVCVRACVCICLNIYTCLGVHKYMSTKQIYVNKYMSTPVLEHSEFVENNQT